MRSSGISRRGFLGTATAATGAAAISVASAPRAQATETSAAAPHGDLRDIKHVIVIMQENRSFDHYYGSLRGVRGFGDRATILQPGGRSVFEQPVAEPTTPTNDTQYPFRLSAAPTSAYPNQPVPPDSETGAQNIDGLPHGWPDQHEAYWGGLMNGWVWAKGLKTTYNTTLTLGYLNRWDLPFHYALADAYTIGDAYHCSVQAGTGPNRTYLWSGTINADKQHGSITAWTGGDELNSFLPWESYAETLQAAGMTWKLYQGSDNFQDNGLEYFKTFAQYDPSQGGTPAPGTIWYDNGVATVPEPNDPESGNADNLALAIKNDVLNGTLPQVSWIVTNLLFSEHPQAAPDDGAYFIHQVLKALAADEDTFNSTLVIIDFDENDGQFDHVPPPAPPAGEPDEWVSDSGQGIPGATQPFPAGLGFRVPLMLISPWTRGGWVTSEVSDHTSVLQFLEKWSTAIGTPALCPNISSWRRRVCGDLTGAFDFKNPVYGLPPLPELSPTALYEVAFVPPPATNSQPTQEAGTKPARPLPYQPNANLAGFTVSGGATTANLTFSNTGPHVRKAVHFAVYNNLAAQPSLAGYPAGFPGQYTVDAGSADAAGAAPVGAASGGTAYDITVIGPNRFLRRFTGDTASGAGTGAEVTMVYDTTGRDEDSLPGLVLKLGSTGSSAVSFTITSGHYVQTPPVTVRVPAGRNVEHAFSPLEPSHGWYDLTVTVNGDSSWSRRFTGHLENGRDSVTG